MKNSEIPKPIENNPPENNSGENQKKVQTENNNRIKIKVCKHAIYGKYFRMIAFGVPMDAVKLKMQTHGLDPSILE